MRISYPGNPLHHRSHSGNPDDELYIEFVRSSRNPWVAPIGSNQLPLTLARVSTTVLKGSSSPLSSFGKWKKSLWVPLWYATCLLRHDILLMLYSSKLRERGHRPNQGVYANILTSNIDPGHRAYVSSSEGSHWTCTLAYGPCISLETRHKSPLYRVRQRGHFSPSPSSGGLSDKGLDASHLLCRDGNGGDLWSPSKTSPIGRIPSFHDQEHWYSSLECY